MNEVESKTSIKINKPDVINKTEIKKEVFIDNIKLFNDRVFVSQRHHAIEGNSFKNQVRCYLFALEAQALGMKSEDIK